MYSTTPSLVERSGRARRSCARPRTSECFRTKTSATDFEFFHQLSLSNQLETRPLTIKQCTDSRTGEVIEQRNRRLNLSRFFRSRVSAKSAQNLNNYSFPLLPLNRTIEVFRRGKSKSWRIAQTSKTKKKGRSKGVKNSFWTARQRGK